MNKLTENLFGKFFTTGLFFYVLSVLMRYGYNSHFGTPYQLIEPSISETILFFFGMLQGGLATLASAVTLLLIYFVIADTTYRNNWVKIPVTLIFIFGSYLFGTHLARNIELTKLPANCIDGVNVETEVVDIFGTDVMLKTIDSDSEIIVRDIKSLNCGIN